MTAGLIFYIEKFYNFFDFNYLQHFAFRVARALHNKTGEMLCVNKNLSNRDEEPEICQK